MPSRSNCPSCRAEVGEPFYALPAVPTNSCLLIDDRKAALDFPVAPLQLCFCTSCGFIYNAAWEPARTAYSEQYEETQGFSQTFNAFQERLVADLIARHGLRGKRIVEIGCGKGEFLSLLCRLGDNEGLGYDPSFVPARHDPDEGRVRVVQEFFGDRSGPLACDFLCCKMTLEHIPNVSECLTTIRRALGDRTDTEVFFQVPDASRILWEGAFWDIYYEHCSYFTGHSLASLFERTGFAVGRIWIDYDGQYLMIEAQPNGDAGVATDAARGLQELGRQVMKFRHDVPAAIAGWRRRLAAYKAAGKRTLLWGSGSKAVAFLTTLDLDGEVAAVVDINPFRQGKFMPKSGHPIIGPQEVAELSPDVVVIMNPIYRNEIGASLRASGCGDVEILTV